MSAIFRFFLNLFPRPFLIRVSYAVRPVLAWLLAGKRYKDPIDGRTYRAFLPYGYGKMRKNALSPGTLSLERHRLLWLYLKNEMDFFAKPQKVLHVAPEQAFYRRFRQQQNLDYTTTDLDSPLADVKADICELPFDDDVFDFVICNHVLEHIPDDRKAMGELYRVLKPGGTAILQVPLDAGREQTYEDPSITEPKARKKAFGQYDHVRIYGRDYYDHLRNAGFTVTEADYTKQFSKEEIRRYALPEGEIIPVGGKGKYSVRS